MEIKRRMTKLASRLSPQIEVMNVGVEMSRLMDRFEELVNYAEEKITRSAERAGNTIGKQVAEKRAAADKQIVDHQTAEAEENLKDQQESFDERNKVVEKSKRPTEVAYNDEGDVMFDPEAVVPEGQVGITDEQMNPTKKEANEKPPQQRKKKASKKKAKKKASKKS